ncbi:MAG TPA: peptidoglycan editing factor PgeF [Ramlibacter sp.]|uniref:peptidoglycan editing factor PgeF n=1 Tax=Ramlibacter sp. TaxID=1917967 RepID=UPI002BD3CE17|nr:peptidoglycan editing factor PgeF [Ramlibacter sp.]HVZ46443.1 peptidoglycan editing factor PgeF [Ramlibacter sp.]
MNLPLHLPLHLPLLLPDWTAPRGVRAACSTRSSGVSAPPYDSLNLGDHVGDGEANVAANRDLFARAIQAQPVFMHQVHGVGVVRLDARTPHGIEADACFTTERGVACTIMVADCLPVLLTDARGETIAAAHCGWRSLSGGVIEAVCAKLATEGAMAWLGPCIGPRAFEVGPEVKAVFEADDAAAARHFKPHREGKWLADLAALARMRLQRCGVNLICGNDGTDAWCTVGNPARFFSHRRDRGLSGRMAACIWRT